MQIGWTIWLVNLLFGMNWDIMRNEASKLCLWGGYFDVGRDWISIYSPGMQWPSHILCSGKEIICWTLSTITAFCVHHCFHLCPYITFPHCWSGKEVFCCPNVLEFILLLFVRDCFWCRDVSVLIKKMNVDTSPHQKVRGSIILLVAMIYPYIWKYIAQWIMRMLSR